MRKETLNGCSYSKLNVYPKNWKTTTSKKSLNENWQIRCRFYDPKYANKYPKGFQYTKKVNHLDTIEKRRAAIKFYLDKIPHLFENRGFNPITNTYMTLVDTSVKNILSINSETHFIEALRFAHKRITVGERHWNEIRKCLNRVEAGAKKLMINVPIRLFTRKYIKAIFIQEELPPSTYNKFKSYLSKCFKELIELEVIEDNPCNNLSRKSVVTKVRETLTKEEYDIIKTYLSKKTPNFYRYMMIFHYSASRSSELFRLKKKDVDIENQEYKIVIEKGGKPFEEIKVILPVAVKYWKEIYDMAKPNDFLFSYGLVPGAEKNSERQITIRWSRHIKKANKKKPVLTYKNGKPMNITADFYSLKHYFMNSLDKLTAQKMASHTNSETTRIYQTFQKQKDREELKKMRLNNSQSLIPNSELIADFSLN